MFLIPYSISNIVYTHLSKRLFIYQSNKTNKTNESLFTDMTLPYINILIYAKP